jgi:spore germination protein GerM
VSRSARVARTIALFAAALLVAGCGLGEDQQPRDIAPDQREELDQTASLGARSPSGVRVYLIAAQTKDDGSVLRAVRRAVSPEPNQLLGALFGGPTADDVDDLLRTAIPPGTSVLATRVADQETLVVDVSPEILSATGNDLIDALAQIVFTASELDQIDNVRVLVDGDTQEWPRSDGSLTTEPLTVFDYPDRNPTSQPDYPAVASPGARTLLAP